MGAGPPVMVFNGEAEALAWGGDRLALLLRCREGHVWAVWDPPEDSLGGRTVAAGALMVAPECFVPHRSFADRIVPFFDQFERRLRFWSPDNDGIVYTTVVGH